MLDKNISIEDIDNKIKNAKLRIASIKISDSDTKSSKAAKQKMIDSENRNIEELKSMKQKKLRYIEINNMDDDNLKLYIERIIETYLANSNILVNIERIIELLDNVRTAERYTSKMALYLAKNYNNIPNKNRYAEAEKLLSRFRLGDWGIFYREIVKQQNLDYFLSYITSSPINNSVLDIFSNMELKSSDYDSTTLYLIYKEAFLKSDNYKLQKIVMKWIATSVKNTNEISSLYYNFLIEPCNMREEFIKEHFLLVDKYCTDEKICMILFFTDDKRRNIIYDIIIKEKLYRSAALVLRLFNYNSSMLKLLVENKMFSDISGVALLTRGVKPEVFDKCDLAMTNCNDPFIILNYILSVPSPRERKLIEIILNSNNSRVLINLWDAKSNDDTLDVSFEEIATVIINIGDLEAMNYIKSKYSSYDDLLNRLKNNHNKVIRPIKDTNK